MKFLKAAIVLLFGVLPALPQSDFEYVLSRHKGNKIVLLGNWNANDVAKWKQLIDSNEIYAHGFALLDRDTFDHNVIKRNTSTLDGWLRQRFGLSASARWLALDNESKLILSGIQIPEPKEFDKLLDAKGIKTPLRKVRDFLRENPGHLDAMADLLKEVRRRALHKMPDGATGDLDDETDLRTWGVMAAETDKVFSGPWLGVDISFFRLGKAPPEHCSKLMKATFRKHISKVEAAIHLHPAHWQLWNIWLWMAAGIGDYKWEKFIDGLQPVIFSVPSALSLTISAPSVEACVWLVGEASTRKEWSVVIKLAKVASLPVLYEKELKTVWLPGNHGGGTEASFDAPPESLGHPVKTVYVPHIEALLRLGDIDEANNVYDRMIRMERMEAIASITKDLGGRNDAYIRKLKTKNAEGVAAVANVARSLGMDNLAQIWERGQQVTPKPSLVLGLAERYGMPMVLISQDYESDLYNKMEQIILMTIQLGHYKDRLMQEV